MTDKANVLNLGPIGTGKTHALLTIPQKKKVGLIGLEPGVHNILTPQNWRCEEDRHLAYIAPAKTPFATMISNAKHINMLTPDQLQKMSKATANASDYMQFIHVLNLCEDYKCERCHTSFGAVDQWGDDWVLACDGLSGLSIMSMDLVVGAKPIKTQPEWGVAMDNLERLVGKWCYDTKCSFILIAHAEKEVNEVSGAMTIMAGTLGRKLAPKLPKFFDEVLLSRREGGNFYWSTVEPQADLKTRVLGWSDRIEPNYHKLWK